MDLDFSRFHPLDHWPWQARCRQFYGGPRYHVVIAWEYRHRENLRYYWHRWVACRFGSHIFTCWSKPHTGEHGKNCLACGLIGRFTEEELLWLLGRMKRFRE